MRNAVLLLWFSKIKTMQRRTFLSQTILSAVAISTSGFIRFDGQRYVGECETTSDVLGPFYRPDSPVREKASGLKAKKATRLN